MIPRVFRGDDSVAVSRLEREAFGEDRLDDAAVYFAAHEPHAKAWVLEHGGELAGWLLITLEKKQVTIERLAVAIDFRRQGIGTRLIDLAGEQLAYGQQLECIVRESNLRAQQFLRASALRCVQIHSAYFVEPLEPGYRFVG